MAKRSKRKPKRNVGRKHGTRSPKDTIVIVCEGCQTEPKYFGALRKKHRLSNVTVKIVKGSGGAQTAVVEKAKKLNNALRYDQTWCVFDCEGIEQRPQFDRAISSAKKEHFDVAVSNPCFEYWLLLHFEFSDAPCSECNDALRKLKRHVPEYTKSMDFDAFIEQIDQAVENARKIENCKNYPNPCTTVHTLVESVFLNSARS